MHLYTYIICWYIYSARRVCEYYQDDNYRGRVGGGELIAESGGMKNERKKKNENNNNYTVGVAIILLQQMSCAVFFKI